MKNTTSMISLREGHRIMTDFIDNIDNISKSSYHRFLHNATFLQYQYPEVMNALLPYYDKMARNLRGYGDAVIHHILIEPFLYDDTSNEDELLSRFFYDDDIPYLHALGGDHISVEQVIMLIGSFFPESNGGDSRFVDAFGDGDAHGILAMSIMNSIITAPDMDDAMDAMVRFLNHTKTGMVIVDSTKASAHGIEHPYCIIMPVIRKALEDSGFDSILHEVLWLMSDIVVSINERIVRQEWMVEHYSLHDIDKRSFSKAYMECDSQRTLNAIYDKQVIAGELAKDMKSFRQLIILDSPKFDQMTMCRGGMEKALSNHDEHLFNAYSLLFLLFDECLKRPNNRNDMIAMDDDAEHDIIAMVHEGMPMDYISEAFFGMVSVKKP